MFSKLIHLFLGNKVQTPFVSDFSSLAVDIHSHLIPGVDDGVKTIEESVEILRNFSEMGFSKIITTPHIMAGGYNNTSNIILTGRDKVRDALKQHQINIEFDAAAEYYLDETMYEKIEKRELLTLGNNYLLIELSLVSKLYNFSDLAYKLQVAGYNIILAHPERYAYYDEKNFESYYLLKDRGIFLQINLMSLIGRYGKKAKYIAEKMIDENIVDFVGTDLHGIRHIPAIKECLHEKHIQKIMTFGKLLNKTLL